ncbi:hypothetical protein PF003_g19813 [Phytophthora fragariae]|nr:hypothetical protein PF003_g19813 [Phytophthora fragariae]
MTDEVEQEKQEKQNVIDHEHTRETHETELAQLNEVRKEIQNRAATPISLSTVNPENTQKEAVGERLAHCGATWQSLSRQFTSICCASWTGAAAPTHVEKVNRRMPWLYPLLMDLMRVSNAEVRAALASVFSKVVGLQFRVVLVAMSDVLGGNGSQ